VSFLLDKWWYHWQATCKVHNCPNVLSFDIIYDEAIKDDAKKRKALSEVDYKIWHNKQFENVFVNRCKGCIRFKQRKIMIPIRKVVQNFETKIGLRDG
jgi:hypothetical protein